VAALTRAVSPGALKRVIDAGADVNDRVKDDHNEGCNALYYLANLYFNGYSSLMRCLTATTLGDYYDRDGMFMLLLKAGADVNVQNSHRWSPLMSLMREFATGGKQTLSLFKAVLAAGADFDADYGTGNSAFTVRMKDINGVKKLIEEEFYGEIRRVFGSTASGDAQDKANANLMMAARWGNPQQVEEALSHGTASAQSASGYTPLMFASFFGSPETVKTLIAAGAKLNAKNTRGETALILAVLNGCEANVKVLIESGIDVNAKSFRGVTALMVACCDDHHWRENIELVKQLVQAGARINDKTEYGQTALGFAYRNEQTAIAQFLLSAGADPGDTGFPSDYFPEIVQKLKKYGVKV
jgi:ankyrin repeat protein